MDRPDRISNWISLVNAEQSFANNPNDWMFRGQPKSKHALATTLERAFVDFDISTDVRHKIEHALITDFMRSWHLYGVDIPLDDDDTLGMLALMRHYGAPCRLLDFSFSFFIATFFAIETGNDPVVWAINKSWLTQLSQDRIEQLPNGSDLWQRWQLRQGLAFQELMMSAQLPLSLT